MNENGSAEKNPFQQNKVDYADELVLIVDDEVELREIVTVFLI